jgi:hypothetical protein
VPLRLAHIILKPAKVVLLAVLEALLVMWVAT